MFNQHFSSFVMATRSAKTSGFVLYLLLLVLIVGLGGASLYVLAGIPTAFAQADARHDEMSKNLRLARERLRKEQQRLETLRKNQKEIQEGIKKLELELRAAQSEREKVEGELAQLMQKATSTSKQAEEIAKTIESRKLGMRERTVAIYKVQKRKNVIDYILGSRSATDFLRRTRYLSRVAQFDINYLQGLSKLLTSYQNQQQELQNLQSGKNERASRLLAIESELSGKRESQAMLLADEKQKVEQQEKSLAKMRVSAERLEQVLAGIMGGEDAIPPAKPDEEMDDRAVAGVISEPRKSESPEVITTPYQGQGLAVLKGKLEFPVRGEILQRFGKQQHEEFTETIFVKGVELRCVLGTKVRAVAAGKVVMNQVLPGYGNVIILDHGQRYYTLYGRLASSFAGLGSDVKAGEEIAILGEQDYRGRNFYFELRVKGKATDPLGYFKSPPKPAAS